MKRVASVVVLAVAVGLVNLYLSSQAGEELIYKGNGFMMRESLAWDEQRRRFLVSRIEGGVSHLKQESDGSFREDLVIFDEDTKGNSTLGITIDAPNNRLLAVHADLLGKNFAALAAYELTTFKRLFLTRLENSGEQVFADDVTVDNEGNSYVTDAAGNLIWKVSSTGEVVSTIRSSVFTSKPNRLPFSIAGLNGIAYHPDGYLLVAHTWSGALFKVLLDGSSSVSLVDAPLLVGADGMKLLSAEKLVVASMPGAKVLESSDGWASAQVVGRTVSRFYRLPTSIVVRDGKPFVNHGLGWRTFVVKEAVFH